MPPRATPHAALLRGINVGGNKMIAMAQLRELASDLGMQNPKTLLQSGNMVFSDHRTPARLEELLETETRKRFSLETKVFVRTLDEWEAAIAANPFTAEAAQDPGRLIALFCGTAPTPSAVKGLQAAIKGRERVAAEGRTVYAVYPDGAGTSKLTVPVIERALSTGCTGRNWNTVLRIAKALAE